MTLVREHHSALAEGVAVVGSYQIRNLATVGGNLANATPSADVAPPLLALEADMVLAGARGQRRLPITEFFVGVRRTQLPPDEIVLPAPEFSTGSAYLRHTPRRELDTAVVGVSSQLTVRDGRCTKARIALGAVAPVPLRAIGAQARL